jgi:hypothetical protein
MGDTGRGVGVRVLVAACKGDVGLGVEVAAG